MTRGNTAGQWRPIWALRSSTSKPSVLRYWMILRHFSLALRRRFGLGIACSSLAHTARRTGCKRRADGSRWGDSLLAGTPLVCADRLRRGDVGALWELALHARYREVSYAWPFTELPCRPADTGRCERDSYIAKLREASPVASPPWLASAFVERTGLDKRLREISVPQRFEESGAPGSIPPDYGPALRRPARYTGTMCKRQIRL